MELEAIRAKALSWLADDGRPTDEEIRRRLDLVRSEPTAWWEVARDLVAVEVDEDRVDLLSWRLLDTVFTASPELVTTALESAADDGKIVSAIAGAVQHVPGERGLPLLYGLLGRDAVASATARYYREESPWDFWARNLFHDLIQADCRETFEYVRRLVDLVDVDDLWAVAAGEVEDLIKECGGGVIELIEAEAGRNEVFRQALRGAWIWDVDPEIFHRVEAAAGVELAQARFEQVDAPVVNRGPKPRPSGVRVVSTDELLVKLHDAEIQADLEGGTWAAMQNENESGELQTESVSGHFLVGDRGFSMAIYIDDTLRETFDGFLATSKVPVVLLGANWTLETNDRSLAEQIKAALGGTFWD